MMNDPFYTQERCDRCGEDLGIRRMSWFNKQTLGLNCMDLEDLLKAAMREKGMDPADYEGCGYIPQV